MGVSDGCHRGSSWVAAGPAPSRGTPNPEPDCSARRACVKSDPDMRLFLSEASVHLSRQFLEKLTDSAIIKIALWEDLSGEVATGSRWLAASPRSLRGVAAGAEPEVRVHLPPAKSRANFRFLSGGVLREGGLTESRACYGCA